MVTSSLPARQSQCLLVYHPEMFGGSNLLRTEDTTRYLSIKKIITIFSANPFIYG